jgi:hypothetical protein
MLFSNEFILSYIEKEVERIESKHLRKSSVYQYALYRYQKKCIFSITRKRFKETKNYMRKMLLRQLCLNLLEEKYNKIIHDIPTATYTRNYNNF